MKRLLSLLSVLVLSSASYADPLTSMSELKPLVNSVQDTPTLYDFLTPLILGGDCPNGTCPLATPSAFVVPTGSHAHRKLDGTILVHGDENWGSATAHAGIASPWWRVAEAGQTVSTHSTTVTTQTAGYRTERLFGRLRERLWYPGKLFFRAFRARSSSGC